MHTNIFVPIRALVAYFNLQDKLLYSKIIRGVLRVNLTGDR